MSDSRRATEWETHKRATESGKGVIMRKRPTKEEILDIKYNELPRINAKLSQRRRALDIAIERYDEARNELEYIDGFRHGYNIGYAAAKQEGVKQKANRKQVVSKLEANRKQTVSKLEAN